MSANPIRTGPPDGGCPKDNIVALDPEQVEKPKAPLIPNPAELAERIGELLCMDTSPTSAPFGFKTQPECCLTIFERCGRICFGESCVNCPTLNGLLYAVFKRAHIGETPAIKETREKSRGRSYR